MASIQQNFSPPVVLSEEAMISIGRNQTKKAPPTKSSAIPIVIMGISATNPKLRAQRINIANMMFIMVSFKY